MIGYKPISDTDETFIICTTDNAKHYIEDSQLLMEQELLEKVQKSTFLVPGPRESENSEKDIEEIKPIRTREKVNNIYNN